MTTPHYRQFAAKLSLLQMKERTITTLLSEPPITGIHATMYAVLVELRRLFPEVRSLTELGRILRPPTRTVSANPPGLKEGLHALLYNNASPKADRQKLELELTQAFGTQTEPCFEYMNLWLDLYLGLLENVVQVKQFFRMDVEQLLASNPLASPAARLLLVTHSTLRGYAPDRFASMLYNLVSDRAPDAPPITLARLSVWKSHFTAVDEYLTLYRKTLKLKA